jgi:hypothetical protein
MEPVANGGSPTSLTNSRKAKRVLLKFRPDSFGHKSTEKLAQGRCALMFIALSHFSFSFPYPVAQTRTHANSVPPAEPTICRLMTRALRRLRSAALTRC